MEAFQEKTGKNVVITGGAPKEGDDSATPEVQQTAGASITDHKMNGRSCRIYTQPTLGLRSLKSYINTKPQVNAMSNYSPR